MSYLHNKRIEQVHEVTPTRVTLRTTVMIPKSQFGVTDSVNLQCFSEGDISELIPHHSRIGKVFNLTNEQQKLYEMMWLI